MKPSHFLIFFVPFIIILTHCSVSSISSNSKSKSSSGSPVKLKLKLEVANTDLKLKLKGIPGGYSYNSATNISSFQIFFTSARIYSNIVPVGSGYNGTPGALPLYIYNGPAYDYNTFDAVAARNTTNGFIDLMDTSSMSNMRTAVDFDSSAAGEYRFLAIDWLQPIKVRASFPLSDGTMIHTKDGFVWSNSFQFMNSNGMNWLTNGQEQTAIMVFNNGGTWFRMLKPLVITPQDISNGTNFNIMLAFNPEGILMGMSNIIQDNIYDDAGYGIHVQGFDAAPIAYRDGETVVRETYIGTLSNTDFNYNTRIEIFTLSNDMDNIYAATFLNMVNGSSTKPDYSYKIFFATTNNNHSVNLLNWDGTSVVSNLTRQTAIGLTSSSIIQTSQGFFPITFTLTSITNMN
jgi:hypothetical protein